MNPHDPDPATPQDAMKNEIRQICHDLSNPLGILRMALYVLQSSKADPEKRAHYFAMMNESLDKMEGHLKKLRTIAVGDQPSGESQAR
jgi:signal transduction histidine kinase